MAKVQFIRQVVAEKYECLSDEDVVIHIGCYSGRLSNINECGAAALLKSKSGYLQLVPVNADVINDAEPLDTDIK